MRDYDFTLRLEGVTRDTLGDFSERLYLPDLDVTPGITSGVAEVDFRISSANLKSAIREGIGHVHRADSSVRVVGVVLDGLTIDEAFAA